MPLMNTKLPMVGLVGPIVKSLSLARYKLKNAHKKWITDSYKQWFEKTWIKMKNLIHIISCQHASFLKNQSSEHIIPTI